MAGNSEKTAKKQRGPGRPFAKGVSGNPSGRRPVPPDVKAILLAGDERAANRLVELVDSEDEALALKASIALLERNHGKPAQPVEGTDGGPLVVQVVSYAAQGEADEDSDPQ